MVISEPIIRNQFETAKVYLLNYVASLTHKHLLSLSFSAFLQENDGSEAKHSEWNMFLQKLSHFMVFKVKKI